MGFSSFILMNPGDTYPDTLSFLFFLAGYCSLAEGGEFIKQWHHRRRRQSGKIKSQCEQQKGQ